MQVTIARQLGLEPTTVGNFFMNARRRSMDKWKDDQNEQSGSKVLPFASNSPPLSNEDTNKQKRRLRPRGIEPRIAIPDDDEVDDEACAEDEILQHCAAVAVNENGDNCDLNYHSYIQQQLIECTNSTGNQHPNGVTNDRQNIQLNHSTDESLGNTADLL